MTIINNNSCTDNINRGKMLVIDEKSISVQK